MPTQSEPPECDHCGGLHTNVPTEALSSRDGEYGAPCPHCGDWHGLDIDDPDNVDRHPAVGDDEPLTCVCKHCNGSFRVEP